MISLLKTPLLAPVSNKQLNVVPFGPKLAMVEKNKLAAREQLLAIQLLLSAKTR